METDSRKITFKKDKFDELINNNFLSLPVAERALIYTMYWANSEKANRDRYEFTRILSMAEDIKKFIEK